MDNPFQSPSLEASEYTPQQPEGSALRSVLAVLMGGVVVDYVGTRAIGYAISFGVLANSDPYTYAAALQSTPIRILTMAAGIACSFFGGMMAAWIARRRQVLHAVLSVTLAHTLVFPQILFANRMAQITHTLLIMIICFCAAAFAGRMCAPNTPVSNETEEAVP